MNEKRYKSAVVLLGTIMLLIQAIAVFMMGGYDLINKLAQSIVSIIVIILTVIFMVLSLKQKKSGPIIGMITGLAYSFQYNIVNFLIGIAFFLFSLSLLVELSKKDEPEKKTENKKTEDGAKE